MRTGLISKAHRLLAPRVAYLIGSRSPDGESNVIPVSNVTSVSTDPQQVLIAIHKRWRTYDSLNVADGFTLSVPRADQCEGIWILGARYSGYHFQDRQTKIMASGLPFIDPPDLSGPVLTTGLGWLSCRIVGRPDAGGDHGMFVGEVTRVEFDDQTFSEDGVPLNGLRPLMQITGNLFTTTTTSDAVSVPYAH